MPARPPAKCSNYVRLGGYLLAYSRDCNSVGEAASEPADSVVQGDSRLARHMVMGDRGQT